MGAQGKVRRLVYAIASSVLALPCAHGCSSDVCDHKDAQNCRNRRCTVVASGEWWTPNHALVQVSRPLAAWRVRRPVVGVLPEWLQFEWGGCVVAVGCVFSLWSRCAWQLPFRCINLVFCALAYRSECAFRRVIRLLCMVWMPRLTPP